MKEFVELVVKSVHPNSYQGHLTFKHADKYIKLDGEITRSLNYAATSVLQQYDEYPSE